MAQIQELDVVTASGVVDALRLPAVVRNQRSPGGSFRRQRPKCELRIGSLNVGTMGGGGSLDVTNMMDTRKLKVLCVQETKWKGDRARALPVGIRCCMQEMERAMVSVSETISKDVVRVERTCVQYVYVCASNRKGGDREKGIHRRAGENVGIGGSGCYDVHS